MDKQDYDNSKAEEFASKMFQFLNSGMLSLMISIGYKTGLFDIIAQLKPSTSQEISQATKLNERYIREWLGAMVTGNIIEYDSLTEKYSLPKEHSAFLTRKSGIDNLAVLAQYVSLMGNVEDKIVECFRNGGGLPYSEYPKFQQLQAEETARIFDSKLTNQILPLIPEILDRLNDGIKLLDIGCGRGRAINLMGKKFPRSEFTGCDISHEGISSAKEEAKNMGLTNVQFEIKDALLVEELGKFDLITAFDTIHDQVQPTKVLKAINASLNNDGFFLMQDIAASSKVEKNIDSLLAPTLYTISTMHCMSVSLAFDGEGLGTMWGKELAVNKLIEARFKDIKVMNVEGDIMNYYYVSRK
ncbi:MAG TPA: class I SAM-dependent methyltransferase [Nitrososphaeraceae archaeon]|nr:class I SAM-dependent methyltransferase [Nitrososphaeraceae archaeon]